MLSREGQEQALRREAVRRRLAGESPQTIAADLGRTPRWVCKWVSRYEEAPEGQDWAESRSRAPHTSPSRSPQKVRDLVVAIRERLRANPRSQYGALTIAWQLRALGVHLEPWTINRILREAEMTIPRVRQGRYQPKGIPYPHQGAPLPGDLHQADLVGPRHLEGGLRFFALNAMDVGSHTLGTEVLTDIRPPEVARALGRIWARVGIPRVCQVDNHSNFRGAISSSRHFGPVVATCLDLGVTPRFIPVGEPWRNGVVERFQDVWDKSFFRTTRFGSLEHLVSEAGTFEDFHNHHHRYSTQGGHTPADVMTGVSRAFLGSYYQAPTRLPTRGKVEVIRFVRSNRLLDLFGHRITLDKEHTYQYVVATIWVPEQAVTVVTTEAEIIYKGSFPISPELR